VEFGGIKNETAYTHRPIFSAILVGLKTQNNVEGRQHTV
jgi:hypothetical protein